ncbi:MAG TPA: dipeptide epimerase [Steroidobacteraceae bacterium]|nr:dipeptide epimerase [Steroidobacteraceae bacterium]
MNPRTRLSLHVETEKWPLKRPFRITGHTMHDCEVVVVNLTQDGLKGRGEAAGVYYLQDDVPAMVKRIESVRDSIEAGIDREMLQSLLPAGGARNAVDCALWDLDAKRMGKPAWELADLDTPRPLLTAHTVGAESPTDMADWARSYTEAKFLKLKLTGEAIDADRIRAVRAARKDVSLSVDANQGFTRSSLQALLPVLTQARVTLVEQPFPIGQDAQLDGFKFPIPIGADESIQGLKDLPGLVGRFGVVNIKLDKCGGLTEGLAIAREARRLGLDVMVGNMTGTSLAMAPGYLVGQLCQVVDLDGPLFLSSDRTPAATFEGGKITCPEALWGAPLSKPSA